MCFVWDRLIMCENVEKKISFEDGANIYKMVSPPYIIGSVKTVLIVFSELPFLNIRGFSNTWFKLWFKKNIYPWISY